MKEKEKDKEKEKETVKNWPDYSWLTMLYLLLFYPTAALTLACVVLPFVPVKLPPVVQMMTPPTAARINVCPPRRKDPLPRQVRRPRWCLTLQRLRKCYTASSLA